MMNHAQCIMRRNANEQQAWIPEKFAVVGKLLELRTSHGGWQNGWEVMSVGMVRPSAEVIADARDYVKWRSVTDI